MRRGALCLRSVSPLSVPLTSGGFRLTCDEIRKSSTHQRRACKTRIRSRPIHKPIQPNASWMRGRRCSGTTVIPRRRLPTLPGSSACRQPIFYRFFSSKIEIRQAICHRMLEASRRNASEIAALPLSAEERLRRFGLSQHQFTVDTMLDEEKVHEMVIVAIEHDLACHRETRRPAERHHRGHHHRGHRSRRVQAPGYCQRRTVFRRQPGYPSSSAARHPVHGQGKPGRGRRTGRFRHSRAQGLSRFFTTETISISGAGAPSQGKPKV